MRRRLWPEALLLLTALAAFPCLPATPAPSCAALAGLRIPAGKIALPTRGADIEQATLMRSSTRPRLAPEYCKVLGAIHPIDASAPDIDFEVDLPHDWNGKAVFFGGGGFDGIIPDVGGPLLGLPAAAAPTPLQRGYATFGSDSGHQAHNTALPTPAVDGAFAMNDEALANYAGDAVKKTHDVAIALIERRYGRAPRHVYAVGGSNGGREAILAAQRWPREYDGVIAAFPFWRAGTNALAFGALYHAFAAPGAYPDPAKRALVMHAAVRQCDRLDGLADGLVSNVEACHFDPAALRCPRGAEAGDTCLSDAQIGALRHYASPFAFPGPAGSVRRYPAFTALSGGEIADPAVLGTRAPVFPPDPRMPLWALFWDQLARFAIARDPSFNPLDLDPTQPGRLASRLNTVVGMLDLRPDLSAFARRGGKLIVYHGLADPLVSHRSSEALRAELGAAMGARRLRSFARFFSIPGYGHGAGAFEPVWDPLSVLETWAEQHQAPGALSVVDASAGGARRSRPLCELGSWPSYEHLGDPRLATSFRCRPNAGAHP